MTTAYDDIIDLPHHVSPTRRHMSDSERAAQFAPFAALTGFGAEIVEEARHTERRVMPDEAECARINACLCRLSGELARCRNGDELPEVEVTYFRPDARKEGGEYRTAAGCVRAVDEFARVLVLCDGTRIPFGDIFALSAPVRRGK